MDKQVFEKRLIESQSLSPEAKVEVIKILQSLGENEQGDEALEPWRTLFSNSSHLKSLDTLLGGTSRSVDDLACWLVEVLEYLKQAGVADENCHHLKKKLQSSQANFDAFLKRVTLDSNLSTNPWIAFRRTLLTQAMFCEDTRAMPGSEAWQWADDQGGVIDVQAGLKDKFWFLPLDGEVPDYSGGHLSKDSTTHALNLFLTTQKALAGDAIKSVALNKVRLPNLMHLARQLYVVKRVQGDLSGEVRLAGECLHNTLLSQSGELELPNTTAIDVYFGQPKGTWAEPIPRSVITD